MKIKVIVIQSMDPLGQKIGGMGTFIKGFVKFTPADFEIYFIGISSEKDKYLLKQWSKVFLSDKEFNFLPLLFEPNENRRTIIPLSLRFTLCLKFFKINMPENVMFFNRIEPTIAFLNNKSPKVVIIHNDIQKQIEYGKGEVLWSKFPWLYSKLENIIFKHLDLIYTVSENSLNFYKSNYSQQKEKFFFVPTWADPELFFSSEEIKVNLKKQLYDTYKYLKPDIKWVLFVGRLQKQKEPLRMIEAFAECYRLKSDTNLIIIGDGNLKEDLYKKIKDLNIEDSVILFPNLNQAVLARFYKAADVFLLTSNFEGMPMSVLEALACGLPVVTTDVGEVKRVVENGYSGEVVKSFESAAITQALIKVLDNPDIYTPKNCNESVSEFTPQKVLEPIYNNIRKLYAQKSANKN